jgi:hypothetical protein
MVYAPQTAAVDRKQIGLPDATLRDLCSRIPTGLWKECRAPGIARQWASSPTITPGNKSRAPGVSFSKSHVAQIGFYPRTIVIACGFLHANLL